MPAPSGFLPVGPRQAELGFVNGKFSAKYPGEKDYEPIDAGNGIGLNPAQIFVSPLGDNANNGTSWSDAVRTGWHGYVLLVLQGGGTLHIADQTHWVDPLVPETSVIGLYTYTQVAGQGAWFRSDPVVPSVPGFLPSVQCDIVGYGPGAQGILNTPFQLPGTAILYAGSNLPEDNRTKPGQWGVYAVNRMQFRNIQIVPEVGPTGGLGQSFYPFRNGWDYNRNPDGSIAYQRITSATRAGSAGVGTTTFTIDLSPAVPIDIGNVQRLQSTVQPGNPWVVHVSYHRTGTVEAPPWGIGSKVWFQTSDPAFTSGAYTVAWIGATTLAASDWDIEFTDGSTTPAVSTFTSTVRSTVAAPMMLIDVETTSAQFPSTQYPVTAVTVTNATTGTISVSDIYGGYLSINVTQSPTSLTNSRLVSHQRDLYMSIGTTFKNCTSRKSQDVADIFRMGPMFDFGSETAFGYELSDAYLVGFKPLAASGVPYDDKRMSAVFGYGGTQTPCSLKSWGITAQQASFRFIMGGTTAKFELFDAVFDTDNNGEPPAAYVIDGDSTSYVTVNDIVTVDNGTGFGGSLNRISGIPASHITGNSANGSAAGSYAPSSNALNGLFTSGLFSPDGSAWTGRCVATFADNQISGKHAAAWRNISPTSRRFAEVARPTSEWGPAPTTTGISDPMGGAGAVRYDDSANFNIALFSFDHTFTFGAGDRLLVSGWVRASAFSFGTMFVVTSTGGGVTWDLSGSNTWKKEVPLGGGGWQYISEFATVTASSGASNLAVVLDGPGNGSGNVMDFFGWSIAYVPAATANGADAAEFSGAGRAVPYYLPVGMAGTFEGQKLIAHGGLGTAARYTVGVASGNITLGSANGKAVELFDETGASIGVLPMLSFTVNP